MFRMGWLRLSIVFVIGLVFLNVTSLETNAEESWWSKMNPINWITVPATPKPKPKLPTPSFSKMKRTASTTLRKSTAPVKSAWNSTSNAVRSTARKTGELFTPPPPEKKVETVGDWMSLPRAKW